MSLLDEIGPKRAGRGGLRCLGDRLSTDGRQRRSGGCAPLALMNAPGPSVLHVVGAHPCRFRDAGVGHAAPSARRHEPSRERGAHEAHDGSEALDEAVVGRSSVPGSAALIARPDGAESASTRSVTAVSGATGISRRKILASTSTSPVEGHDLLVARGEDPHGCLSSRRAPRRSNESKRHVVREIAFAERVAAHDVEVVVQLAEAARTRASISAELAKCDRRRRSSSRRSSWPAPLRRRAAVSCFRRLRAAPWAAEQASAGTGEAHGHGAMNRHGCLHPARRVTPARATTRRFRASRRPATAGPARGRPRGVLVGT